MTNPFREPLYRQVGRRLRAGMRGKPHMRKAAVSSERTKMKDVNVPLGGRPALEQVSDEVLPADAKGGNTEAYGELVRRY